MTVRRVGCAYIFVILALGSLLAEAHGMKGVRTRVLTVAAWSAALRSNGVAKLPRFAGDEVELLGKVINHWRTRIARLLVPAPHHGKPAINQC